MTAWLHCRSVSTICGAVWLDWASAWVICSAPVDCAYIRSFSDSRERPLESA